MESDSWNWGSRNTSRPHKRDLHRGTHSQVRVGHQQSPPFLTESDLGQGGVLALSLFCRAVDWVLKESLHHTELTVSDEQFSNIDYADDIAVVDYNQLNLRNTLERMEGARFTLGLHISWTKTKIQTLGLAPFLQML